MDLARGAEEVAGQFDELVAPADEPENAVLVDSARLVDGRVRRSRSSR